jgi:hypothetical protein
VIIKGRKKAALDYEWGVQDKAQREERVSFFVPSTLIGLIPRSSPFKWFTTQASHSPFQQPLGNMDLTIALFFIAAAATAVLLLSLGVTAATTPFLCIFGGQTGGGIATIETFPSTPPPASLPETPAAPLPVYTCEAIASFDSLVKNVGGYVQSIPEPERDALSPAFENFCIIMGRIRGSMVCLSKLSSVALIE